MKLNWGIGAFSLFGGFVVFIVVMVFMASNQAHELVTDDYYQKELEFKEVLKKKEKTKSLSGDFGYTLSNGELVVVFPVDGSTEISGTLFFFKPSSKKDDKEIPFAIAGNTLKVDVEDFAFGMYKMKVDWSCWGEDYYYEAQIDIPAK